MNETLADIIAEMRHCLEMTSPRQRYAPKISLRAWSNLADRIEAAAELEEIKLRESEAKILLREYAAAPDESLTPSALELKRELLRLVPGNAAAMRKALLRVKEARGRDLEYVTLADIDAEVDAALDLPPRNCDMFNRWETAREVFEAENWQRLRHINPYLDVIKWLFDPAYPETEGESDGSK